MSAFLRMVKFFLGEPKSAPGGNEYNASFCRWLSDNAPADAASIWQADGENQLHLVSSTDIDPEQAADITLREGEGIGGAAALTRWPVSVSNAQEHAGHDFRIDRRFGKKTHAMLSAPLLFEGHLYGVLNLLNHDPGRLFPPDAKEGLLAAAVLYAASLAKSGAWMPAAGGSRTLRTGALARPRDSEGKGSIVGISGKVQEALHCCLMAGRSDIAVLICGETGTGKELAARRIHEAGLRARGPFLGVNCAALTETLLESELFGHVRGAFTGAVRNRQGKFVAAAGGTLFLDEIGEMSLACQAKILRALEEKKVTPLGSEKAVAVDTRIIASTNKNLPEMVTEMRFREDLYYRLCGLEITMPPLRERREDIRLLAIHFLNRAVRPEGGPLGERPLRLSPEVLAALEKYGWPGNIRQLEQAVSAAAALCEGEEIRPEDLPGWFRRAAAGSCHGENPADGQPLFSASTVPQEEVPFPCSEKVQYLEALHATRYRGTERWNVSAAARALGIPRETLSYRLKKQGFSQQNGGSD